MLKYLKVLFFSMVLIFIFSGSSYNDTDGVIPFQIDLTCKNPSRLLLGYETRVIVFDMGMVKDTSYVFTETNSSALADTFVTTIEENESVIITTRLFEKTVSGDTIEGYWSLNSQEIFHEDDAPSAGCNAPSWLGNDD
jgi:hypothetical protein